MIRTLVQVKISPKALENRPEWDYEAVKSVLPLVHIAQLLASEVRARVITQSMDADGNRFSLYADNREKDYVFWVDKSKPQPGAGRIIGPTPKTGVVGYKSSRAYHESLTGASHKNFYVSGKMWKSLRVRAMSPHRVIVAFYGSSEGWFKKGPKGRKTRNADKAFYAAKRERLGLLWVSDEEADRVYKFLLEMYDAKLSVLLRERDNRFQVSRTAGRIQRAIKRSERKLVKINSAN